jgi:hypothetical protein
MRLSLLDLVVLLSDAFAHARWSARLALIALVCLAGWQAGALLSAACFWLGILV